MVKIKCKNSFLDIYLGSVYTQFIFPTNLIWIFAYLYGFRNYFSLLSAHQYLPFAVSTLIWVLTLFIIILVVSFLLVAFNSIAGRFNSHYRLNEFIYDGTTKISRSADAESREDRKAINYVVETRSRFFIFKNGGKYEILNKKYIHPADMGEIQDYFKPKKSLILTAALNFLPILAVLLTGLTATFLLHTAYTVETSPSPMTAFWKDDELVIAIPSEKIGMAQRLFDNYCPAFLHRPELAYHPPYYEVHFFNINQGKLSQFTVSGNDDINFFASGDDLYYLQFNQQLKIYFKYNGTRFVPVTPVELAALTTAMKDPHAASSWKPFTLWDENDEETYDPEKDQDNWASFPLKTKPVKVHFVSKTMTKNQYIQDADYSLQGLGPAPVPLAHFNSEPQKIDKAQFQKWFPVKKLAEMENEQ